MDRRLYLFPVWLLGLNHITPEIYGRSKVVLKYSQSPCYGFPIIVKTQLNLFFVIFRVVRSNPLHCGQVWRNRGAGQITDQARMQDVDLGGSQTLLICPHTLLIYIISVCCTRYTGCKETKILSKCSTFRFFKLFWKSPLWGQSEVWGVRSGWHEILAGRYKTSQRTVTLLTGNLGYSILGDELIRMVLEQCQSCVPGNRVTHSPLLSTRWCCSNKTGSI